ncbi:hypothetical protein FACS1894186_2000 [Alphaproteobacteria bacterium]|nr:hypothetical protein FACS1894186_2000 [Alphaproteobacteria bacterium]
MSFVIREGFKMKSIYGLAFAAALALAACAGKKDSGNYYDGTGGLASSNIISQRIEMLGSDLKMMQDAQRRSTQDLQQIREKAIGDISQYYETVATIYARLQIGTTSGNPMLKEKWRTANTQLASAAQNVDALRRLGTQISTDASMTNYVKESVRLAFDISGATEQDHKKLRAISDEIDRTADGSDRMVADIEAEVKRQAKYIDDEQKKLTALAAAINRGTESDSATGFLGTSAPPPMPAISKLPPPPLPASVQSAPVKTIPTPPPAAPAPAAKAKAATQAPAAAPAKVAARTALVSVSGEEGNLEEKIFPSLQAAIDRNAGAKFDVVGVASTTGGRAAAEAKAKKVMDALVGMGMPKDRLTVATQIDASAKATSVRVYENK